MCDVGEVPAFSSCTSGMKLYNYLQFTLTEAIPWVSVPPLAHSHEAVHQPFFLRLTAHKCLLEADSLIGSYVHLLSFCLSTKCGHEHSPWTFLPSPDVILTSCLRCLNQHLLSLHSPYFARLFFYIASALPIFFLWPSGAWIFETGLITWIYHSSPSTSHYFS